MKLFVVVVVVVVWGDVCFSVLVRIVYFLQAA